MKKILEKILCRWFRIHKVNEDEWSDSFGWSEEYLGQTNHNNIQQRKNRKL
jgi:hypothetical protein